MLEVWVVIIWSISYGGLLNIVETYCLGETPHNYDLGEFNKKLQKPL